jgi:hypothetical protein
MRLHTSAPLVVSPLLLRLISTEDWLIDNDGLPIHLGGIEPPAP